MYKSSYDNDVTLWSPAGRLHQLEYACSAVQQGSVVIGLRSNTHAVLVGLRRAPSDLAYHQEKLFIIDNHIGIGVSGLIADGRRLCKYMRNETLNYKYLYNKSQPLSRLVLQIADKQQIQTQTSSGRPFGVGLLIIGIDENGPHLYETDPAGNYYEYFGHAIGARDQAAKTYLEKKYETFSNIKLEELIQHGVNALKETVRTKDIKLNSDNTAIMYCGIDKDIKLLNDEEIEPYTSHAENDEQFKQPIVPKEQEQQSQQQQGDGGGGAAAPSGGGAEPMEVDNENQ
jgi:20S proteasome subunit alpha 6